MLTVIYHLDLKSITVRLLLHAKFIALSKATKVFVLSALWYSWIAFPFSKPAFSAYFYHKLDLVSVDSSKVVLISTYS